MRITPDTNILVRLTVRGDVDQARRAATTFRRATLLAVPIMTFCEYVWVLRRVFKQSDAVIADAIRRFLALAVVQVDRAAVEAGLVFLDAGADFADGVIAYQGARSGGDRFVSFDRRAVAAAIALGMDAGEPDE